MSFRRRARPFRLLVLLFGLVAIVSGCTRAINHAAERRIRDELPDLIGPARRYQVRVEGSAGRAAHGRLQRVIVDGDDVQLSNGLLLDQLHLELKNVEADLDSKSLRHVDSARFTAVIGEAGLDEFLAGEAPEGETIRKTHVALDNNTVTLSAERVVLGVGIPFHVTGPLRIIGPQKIEIDSDRLTVAGLPISGLPLRFLKERFESAIDLSTLPLPVHVEAVQTTKGKLILSGTADVTAPAPGSAGRAR
jgi:hypothetical protein